MSQKGKYIILHIELPDDGSVNLNAFDTIEILKRYISTGASQLLLHYKQSHSYVSSFLSFEGHSYNETSESKSQRFEENKKKAINADEFDEELNEIRFIKDPNYYHQFSNNLQTLLVTNNEKNVNLANTVKIDYSYIQFNDGLVSQLLREGTNDVELLIIDYKLPSNDLSCLNIILKELHEYEQEQQQVFINIIISPFLQEEETAHYLNPEFRLNNLKNQETASILANILPVQTWQTYQGQINESFQNAPKLSSLSIFYDKNGCRQDSIVDFSNLKQNLDKLGFSHINAQYLFREITFKLGKLPKYGA